MLARLSAWARTVRRDVFALYLAGRDPRVPWYAKAMAIAAAAYALSPIDLIPDFIPVIGYLDELIVLPLLIVMAVRAIPDDVMADLRDTAERRLATLPPRSRAAAVILVLIWLAVGAGLMYWLAGL